MNINEHVLANWNCSLLLSARCQFLGISHKIYKIFNQPTKDYRTEIQKTLREYKRLAEEDAYKWIKSLLNLSNREFLTLKKTVKGYWDQSFADNKSAASFGNILESRMTICPYRPLGCWEGSFMSSEEAKQLVRTAGNIRNISEITMPRAPKLNSWAWNFPKTIPKETLVIKKYGKEANLLIRYLRQPNNAEKFKKKFSIDPAELEDDQIKFECSMSDKVTIK